MGQVRFEVSVLTGKTKGIELKAPPSIVSRIIASKNPESGVKMMIHKVVHNAERAAIGLRFRGQSFDVSANQLSSTLAIDYHTAVELLTVYSNKRGS